MPGEFDYLRQMLDALPHAQELGVEALSLAADRVELRTPYDDRLVGDPATGVVHGGVVTTLLDTACGMAAVAGVAARAVATLDLRIDYMRPARPGSPITARAECYRRTKRIAFLRAFAWDESDADPVASAAGAFMVERA